VDVGVARWLVSDAAAPALALACGFADPQSLSAADAMRKRWTPEQSAAALTQAWLRRKARTKFGAAADQMFFTPDGLQQATRPAVAQWRAGEYAAHSQTAVVDFGCGIGADSLAFARAGLQVMAVERDPVTAVFAQANLAAFPSAAVITSDELPPDAAALFLDPARRTAAGRSWRVADLSPSWEFCLAALRGRFGCLKCGPGLGYEYIPSDMGAVWASDSGDLVELALWRGSRAYPAGFRGALVGQQLLATDPGAEPAPVRAETPGFIYEPDPAVIRAGGVARLAAMVSGWQLAENIAYIGSQELTATGFATAFAVLEVLDYDERALAKWVRAAGVGVLEIKARGIDVDPAKLRRRLKPRGDAAATLILSPTSAGARAFAVTRCRAQV
jgi:SAM-dependent methyltransferase